MPLPQPNTSWPPAPWDQAYRAYDENEAWYLGGDRLERFYQNETSRRPTHRVAGELREGGVAGFVSRFFWGRPVPAGENRSRIHVPAPADVAAKNAANIFGESPEIQLPVAMTAGASASQVSTQATAQQKRLDVIASSDQARAMFNTMGELKSVLGATILASEWDVEVADHVFLTTYGVDVAIPEFRKGKMIACTMWTEYRDGNVFYRHLERHEIGRILHGLYQGTADKLGQLVPLADRPETAYLAQLVNADSAIETGIDRLTASYNMNLPTRAWRKSGQLAFAGRSDFAEIHPLFDALDETFSSWMRDLKLGAGKVLVPEPFLKSLGRGKGASYDLGQEFFVGLNAPGNPDKMAMDQIQFEIRTEEHEATAKALWKEIYRAAGLGTRGIDDSSDGGRVTATGELLRDKTEDSTRDQKILYDKRAIAEQSSVALELDGKLFPGKGGGRFELPDVIFPDTTQVDEEKNARTIQYLDAATAISTWQKVKRANPDWDDRDISDEAAKILREKGSAAPDPSTFDGLNDPNADPTPDPNEVPA